MKKISFNEKLSYGAGDGATAFAAVTVGSFAMYYFTDVIGLSATLLGTVLFFTRLFDAITNVLMGYIVDITKTKHGKARPWILWSAIPLAISIILLFSASKGWSETFSIIYAVTAYQLFFLIYTASNIPYGTLGALITQDPKERSMLNVFRMISFFIMMLLILNITVPLVEFFGGDPRAWQIVAIIYSVIMVLIFLYTFYFTKERVTAAQKQERISLLKSFNLLLNNKYWILVFLIMLMTWTLLGTMTGINVYYADHILKDAALVGVLSMYFLLPLLIGFFSMPYLLNRFKRRNIIIAGLVLLILGSSLILIKTDSLLIVYSGSILRGIGFAPIMGSAYAMLADTIDYGEWKQGIRIEGIVYSGGTFSTTLAGGLSAGIAGWVLGFGGYISGVAAGEQPQTVKTAIETIFIHIPIVLAVITIGLMVIYKLDKEYPKILKDLKLLAEK
ncbi:sugar transporter [Chelonobacter oris]|uniref:Sugar transporter n=1 Tax=Chelonobacter oris TaxID=505317 RepID=A0A0A3B9Q5_9PAST|nr:glycoside-pentoside-hexuronide (GPH):cation symporter [Chelonobacter oris]KGQ70299.1 sugar transporter [Chelonobacter oris]